MWTWINRVLVLAHIRSNAWDTFYVRVVVVVARVARAVEAIAEAAPLTA